jgi:hypothetical protein
MKPILIPDADLDTLWQAACARFARDLDDPETVPPQPLTCACNDYPFERSPSCRIHPARLTRDADRPALNPPPQRQPGRLHRVRDAG